MKKISPLIVVILFSLISNTVSAASQVEKVLDAYISAWNNHDIEKISSFYAKDVIWYDLTSDTKIQGKGKVSKAITDYFIGYVPNMYWVNSGDIFVSGNTVVYEWVYGGTFNGYWGETKITNKDFMIKGISTTTINDDGKIIATKDYYDLASFTRVLGVSP